VVNWRCFLATKLHASTLNAAAIEATHPLIQKALGFLANLD
jgi:hypothetical protein